MSALKAGNNAQVFLPTVMQFIFDFACWSVRKEFSKKITDWLLGNFFRGRVVNMQTRNTFGVICIYYIVCALTILVNCRYLFGYRTGIFSFCLRLAGIGRGLYYMGTSLLFSSYFWPLSQ